MRKPGFARISAALLISCLYTFFSCFVGTACPKEISAEALTSESEKATVTAKDGNVSDETAISSQSSATENPDSDIPLLDLSQIPDTPPTPSNETQNGELLFDLTYSVTPDFSIVTTPIVVTTEKTTQPTTPSATKPTTTPASSSTTPQTTTTPGTETPTTGASQSESSSSSTTTTTTTTTPSTTPATTPAPKGWTGNLTVYNNLPSAPDYNTNVTADAFTIICRTVQAEMGERFEKEALKAQAVAAYSYIMSQSKVPVLPLSATVSDKVRQAVSEVNGMAVYYDGGYAQTVYCASSAGATANSQDIWGGYLPYLVSVDCPVDEL
ncbi:MAG: SpoIID/LytB domain-containing protein, partial [Oscillospiraceae bacterium]